MAGILKFDFFGNIEFPLGRLRRKRDVAKIKLLITKIPAKISLPLAMSTHTRKKSFKLFKKPKTKYLLGRSWAKIVLRKTQPNIILKRRDSQSTEDIDPQNRRMNVPWNLKWPRSLGAPSHPLVTVFTKRPVIIGGRLPGVWHKHIWALMCRIQETKFPDPAAVAKRGLFQVLREERRTPWATFRTLNHGSDRYFRGRHLQTPT